MSITRSLEEGMYILREGDCLWRVNKDGTIDCTAKGNGSVFTILAFIQQWKTPSKRIFQQYPLGNSMDD